MTRDTETRPLRAALSPPFPSSSLSKFVSLIETDISGKTVPQLRNWPPSD